MWRYAPLLWIGVMSAQFPPLIDRELFFGDPQLVGVEISPDGRWLSFVKPYKGTLNIWIQPIQNGELGEAFPITQSERRPITEFFWSYDSQYILYIQDQNGDENYHLYRIAIAEASPEKIPPATDLTPRAGVQVRLYAFPRNKPNIAFIGLNDRDPSLHDLYELDLSTGRLTLLHTNTEGFIGWSIDHLGRIRLAGKVGPEGENQIFLVERKGKNFSFKKIYETAWDESATIAYLPQKGDEIFLLTNKDVDKLQLVALNPKSGKERLIHRDPEDRVDVSGVLFDEKSDKLRVVIYTDDRRRRYFFDPKLEKWFEKWDEILPDGEIGISGLSDDERYAVVVYSSDREPARYYLWDGQRDVLKEIGRSRPDLPTEHLAEMRPIRIRARDGAEIPAYLTLPKGEVLHQLPAVLYVHGGPWSRDYWGYEPTVQFLANRGYAVLQVNFRGSTGYGKAFLNAGNKAWGTGIMQHDLTDAVQQLIREGIFDPRRIAIMGGSYGGYAALAGVAFTPDLYACGVSIVGPSSLLTLIQSVPPYWRPLMKILEHRVGNPNDPQDVERLKAQSPLYHVERIRVPLLIIQGANDPRVKQQESAQIVAALHAQGYPVRYLLAPDEGHGFHNYDNRMAMMVAIEQFLAEHLGGRLQPDVPEKIAQRLAQITVDPATIRSGMGEAVAPPAPPLRLNLSAPRTTEWIYRIRIANKEVIARQQEKWEKLPKGWRYTTQMESSDLPLLRSQDTTELGLDGQVKAYHAIQQETAISLQREGTTIKGTLQMMGQTNPFSLSLADTPFYPPNSALFYYLGSLPLEVGYTASIPLISIQQQRLSTLVLTVESEDRLPIRQGLHEAWRVRLDSDNTQQTVWLDKSLKEPVRVEILAGDMKMVGERVE